ncbi:MAG: hypothetical protein ABSB59_33685 [Streptosporangiaceae bacterium]
MVDAGLLRRCCAEFRDEIDPRDVRLKGALAAGALDLAGLDVPFPLDLGIRSRFSRREAASFSVNVSSKSGASSLSNAPGVPRCPPDDLPSCPSP